MVRVHLLLCATSDCWRQQSACWPSTWRWWWQCASTKILGEDLGDFEVRLCAAPAVTLRGLELLRNDGRDSGCNRGVCVEEERAKSKLKYFVWAASRCPRADSSCPACQSSETLRIKRKYLVTALYLCDKCRLMFRVPKPSEVDNDLQFYQEEYSQGFTTDCPSPSILEELEPF